MPENWSVDEENIWKPRTLIPSNGTTTHPDPRMHLSIKDIPSLCGQSGNDLAQLSEAALAVVKRRGMGKP